MPSAAVPAPAGQRRVPSSAKRRAGLLVGPVLLLVLWFAPPQEAPAAQHAIAIASLMIVFWATEAIPHQMTGLLGLFLFWMLGVSRFGVVFSSFLSETVWYLFGAILIGGMASASGLARRIAYWVTARVGTTYSRLILAFTIVDFLLTFLIPSGIARVTVLAAIVAGTVQSIGAAPRSNAARGLLIIVTYTASIFDKMIIAGAASILARGIIQQVGNVRVLYSQWFIAYLPADLITILCAWRIILWLYPTGNEPFQRNVSHLQAQLAALGPRSPAETRCAALLACAVGLWMTDFLHHLSPAAIAIGVGLLAITPKVGVLGWRDLRTLPLRVLIFTASALGMSRVLADTGGLETLTGAMVGWMEPHVHGPFSAALVFYWTAFFYHFFLGNETAMLSSSLPAVLNFARDQGIQALPAGMIWTFGASGKIFAYQSSVIMVGYSYGYFDSRDLFKVGLILTIIESIVLLALVPFYWPLIGIG